MHNGKNEKYFKIHGQAINKRNLLTFKCHSKKIVRAGREKY